VTASGQILELEIWQKQLFAEFSKHWPAFRLFMPTPSSASRLAPSGSTVWSERGIGWTQDMTLNPMQKASLAATFAKAQNQQKGQATFLGIKPPLEVEQLSITLNTSPLEKASFRKVLAFVFEYMKGTDVTEHHWAQLKEATSVDEIILSTVFSGALSLVRSTTRSRTPMETFSSDCMDVLKIPREFVVEMGLAIQNWYAHRVYPPFALL